MIDFNDTLTRRLPLSEEALAQARRRLTQQKAALEHRKQQFHYLYWTVICLGFILMGASSYFEWTVVGLAMAVTTAVWVMAVFKAGVGAGVGGMAGVGGAIVTGTMDTAAGMVVAEAIAIAVVVAVAVQFLFKKYLEEPLNATDAALANLVELEATDKPDECIQTDEWREQDETIGAYLRPRNKSNSKQEKPATS